MPQKRTLKGLTKELIDNPFFPLLFGSEAVKILALNGLVPDFWRMSALFVASTIIWVLSDAIDVDIDADSITG